MNKETAESTMLNFIIASLISADSNITNNDRLNNINMLTRLLDQDIAELTEFQEEAIYQGILMLSEEIQEND